MLFISTRPEPRMKIGVRELYIYSRYITWYKHTYRHTNTCMKYIKQNVAK